MINRFDPDFNAEIRRVVYNFNRKRNRGIKRGFKYTPRKQYVRDIKEQFSTRGEIENYLNQLEQFNVMGESAFDVVKTEGGASTSRYNYNFVKDNLEATKAFYDKQIEEARRIYDIDQFSMAKRDYLFNLEEKRKELELNISELTQSQFNAFERATNRMMDENRMKINGYRGFLDIVDKVMRNTGVDKSVRKEFFDKMSTLSPAQFTKMYRNNDLINRIYEIVPSPEKDGAMNTTDEDARNLINDFLQDFEEIKDAAEKV